MDYLRQTVNSDALASIFDLPASLRSRRVEVIILPADGGESKQVHEKSAKGCLKKYANPALITEEQGAWQSAMEDKHANR